MRKFAASIAARARKETGDDISYYKCNYCHRYHIGHSPGQHIKAMGLIDPEGE